MVFFQAGGGWESVLLGVGSEVSKRKGFCLVMDREAVGLPSTSSWILVGDKLVFTFLSSQLDTYLKDRLSREKQRVTITSTC